MSTTKENPFTGILIKRDSVILVYKGKPEIIHKSAPNYNEIIKALKNADWDRMLDLANLKVAITKLSQGRVKVMDDDSIFVDDKKVAGALVDRIIEMLHENFDVSPYLHFLDKVEQNPSASAKEELFIFLEHNDLPLDDKGNFLGYKMVRGDYLDIYSGTISNRVGDKPSMDRSLVDADRHVTCSRGLHVCAEGYLTSAYGHPGKNHRVIVVKVNPKDVVSVPVDYNNAKMRVCEYEVIAELENWGDRLKKYYTSEYSNNDPTPKEFSFDNENSDEDDSWVDSEEKDEEEEDVFFEDNDEDDEESSSVESYEPMVSELNEEGKAQAYNISLDKYRQIIKVRKLAAQKYKISAIAKLTGISERQVGRIIKREAWGQIP